LRAVLGAGTLHNMEYVSLVPQTAPSSRAHVVHVGEYSFFVWELDVPGVVHWISGNFSLSSTRNDTAAAVKAFDILAQWNNVSGLTFSPGNLLKP